MELSAATAYAFWFSGVCQHYGAAHRIRCLKGRC